MIRRIEERAKQKCDNISTQIAMSSTKCGMVLLVEYENTRAP